MKNIERKIIPLSLCLSLALSANAKAEEKTILEEIKVSEELGYYISEGTTEGVDSYTTKSMGTATKLNLSVKDTPQSVKVLTNQYLKDTNISSYQDVLEKIPGVTLNRWDERVNASARGFDIDYYKIDGMPTYSTYNERDFDLSVYDRVELVKGANGLTTGYGNPSMSINLVRKRANSKELTGDISATAGSWDSYGIAADVGSALNESGSVRGRVVLKHEEQDSYMDNYKRENNLFYGVIDSDLSDTTYLSTGVSYQNLDRDGVRWGGLPAFYSDGTRTDFSRSKTVSDDWTYWNSEIKSVFADLKQYLPKDMTLNLSYAYDEINTDTALLYFSGKVNKVDGSGLQYMDWEAQTQNKQHNIDLSMNIPYKLAKKEHELVIGTSYNLDKTTKYEGRYPNGYYSTLNNFYDYNLTLPSASSSDAPYILQPEQIEQKAIYLANNILLMDDLKFIVGARVSNWEYTSKDSTKQSRKFDNELTPYVGLVYDLDKNHSIYTSYTSIFKPQDKKTVSGEYLDPIEGNNYEIGIKGEYFDNRLNTSLALFRIEQDNVAEDDPSGTFVPGTTTVASVSADGVTSKGFEFDIAGQITDNFSMDFGLANFEAEDANGEKFNTKASRTTANIFAKYKVNEYRAGLGLNYKSKIYTGTGLSEITQDAYITTDLMLGYELSKNTDLQLNINNIFDKEYYTGIGANSMVYGDPRNTTLTMRYKF
jgi:outer membrane receptor for ferric coprogen and ferric-rhodotorulic acid